MTTSNQPKPFQELTSWDLVLLGTTHISNPKNLQKSTKTFPGINLVVLDSPWANAYLEPQQKEQFYLVFMLKRSRD